jgi:alpha-tubulin suppressor-like RCC1 family protein
VPAGVPFQSIAVGDVHTCGVVTDGTLRCWGDRPDGVQQPPAGTFSQVSVGEGACALRADGSATCWGQSEATGDPERQPPPISFRQISVAGNEVCGLEAATNKVRCWGKSPWNLGATPEGEFTTVAAGENAVCALRPGGAVVCWGIYLWPDEPRPTKWK